MASRYRDTSAYPAKWFLGGKWLLSVYVIKCDPDEMISDKEMTRIIEMHLVDLENKRTSAEFEYYKTGFAFLHYGNRGIDLTVWHFGKWGDTFETFVCSWYCYERDICNMEALDSAEPVLSQYEMHLFVKEMSRIGSLIDCVNARDFRVKFISAN